MIEFYFDGACEPVNPGGHASYGYVIYHNKKKLEAVSGYVGVGPGMSNNVAEYEALVQALVMLNGLGLSKETILARGDSMLVVNQMSGLWGSKGGLYIPYMNAAKTLAVLFSDLKFEWVPRAKNSVADALSKEALTARGVRITVRSK